MRRALTAIAALTLLLALAAGGVAYWLQRPLPLAATTAELAIEPGTSPRRIAEGWVAAGVQAPVWMLYEWFRWSGESRRIRAGSYEIDGDTTPIELLDAMIRGGEKSAFIRLGEGWTMRQVRAELAAAEALKPTIAGLSDGDLMAALGEPGAPAEGRFFPDTYSYSRGSSDLSVLKRARRAMQRQLAEAWAQRAANIPLATADEALALASIIEKETGIAADRGKVAAVFINRLRIGMPLQTDPTVIYGLGEAFDGNLRKKDLQTDTPFNSYTRSGLPPTPIAMPGKASLLAAVRPDTITALYFVARGDGSSEFSNDLAAHNRAVNKYQRGR